MRGIMNKQRPLLSVVLSAVFGLCASAAWSEEAPPVETPHAPTNQIEEITVTATRRETNLQRTPVSVTAITSSPAVFSKRRILGH